jgi:hypothetical protein
MLSTGLHFASESTLQLWRALCAASPGGSRRRPDKTGVYFQAMPKVAGAA